MACQPALTALPGPPVRLPSVVAIDRHVACAPGQPPVETMASTVPVELLLAIALPFARTVRMTSLKSVLLSDRVKALPAASARNTFPLVWTRPPKLKGGPAKKERSVSEKI